MLPLLFALALQIAPPPGFDVGGWGWRFSFPDLDPVDASILPPITALTSAPFVKQASAGTLQVGSVNVAVPPDFNGFLDVSVQCGTGICFPPVSNWASFAGADTATLGNWQGVYGADGFSLATDASSAPSYGTAVVADAELFQWSASTADPRALLRPGGADRVAGTWFTGRFTIEVDCGDSSAHQLALYLVDWENAGRKEDIAITDVTGAVLDTQHVSAFSGGEYLVWNVSGKILITVTSTNPATNAVVSGIFFGPSAAIPPPVPGEALPDSAVVMVNARQDTRAIMTTDGSNGYGLSFDQPPQFGAVTFQVTNGQFVQQ